MRDYNGDSYQVTGSISMPIFTGGLNWSNIRKAQEINNRDRYYLVESKRKLKSQIKKVSKFDFLLVGLEIFCVRIDKNDHFYWYTNQVVVVEKK